MSARKRFPDEAPVFEVIETGEYLDAGALVEGIGTWDGGSDTSGRFISRVGIGGRVLDDNCLKRRPSHGGIHPIDGWTGLHFQVNHVKPLTPAAVAMLEIARGAK